MNILRGQKTASRLKLILIPILYAYDKYLQRLNSPGPKLPFLQLVDLSSQFASMIFFLISLTVKAKAFRQYAFGQCLFF